MLPNSEKILKSSRRRDSSSNTLLSRMMIAITYLARTVSLVIPPIFQTPIRKNSLEKMESLRPKLSRLTWSS